MLTSYYRYHPPSTSAYTPSICSAGKKLFLSQLWPLILDSLCFFLLWSHHRDDVIAMLPCQLALILSNRVEGIFTTIFSDPESPHHYIMPFTYTARKRQSHRLVFTKSPLEPHLIVWMHCHNLGSAQKYHPVSEQVVYFSLQPPGPRCWWSWKNGASAQQENKYTCKRLNTESNRFG